MHSSKYSPYLGEKVKIKFLYKFVLFEVINKRCLPFKCLIATLFEELIPVVFFAELFVAFG